MVTYERLIDIAIERDCRTPEVGMLVMLYRHGGNLPSRELEKKVNDSLTKIRLTFKKLREKGLVVFDMEQNQKGYTRLIYRLNIDENGPLKTEGPKEGD